MKFLFLAKANRAPLEISLSEERPMKYLEVRENWATHKIFLRADRPPLKYLQVIIDPMKYL